MSADLAILSDPAEIDRIADPAGYVIASCERAKVWLAHALEHGGIEDIVELKSQAEAIRVYTMQKQLGKDAELSAAEIVRRAERGIGLAIRKGQESGEIRKRGVDGGPRQDYRRNGRLVHVSGDKELQQDAISPRTFFTNAQEVTETYALTDDVPEEQFEAAITKAKAEGNLSRANVVRKVKNTAPAARDRPEILRKTHRLKPERVIGETVIALEGLCIGVALLEDEHYEGLDAFDIEEWSSSLTKSLRSLNRFAKELNRHVRV